MSILYHIAVKFGITRPDIESINPSVECFESYLLSGKNSYEKVGLFDKTLQNIFHNLFPNKIILCDDEDHPWMNFKESLATVTVLV